MFKALVGALLAIASCAALAQPAITASGTTLSFAIRRRFSPPIRRQRRDHHVDKQRYRETDDHRHRKERSECDRVRGDRYLRAERRAPVTVNAGATCTIGATFDRPLNAGPLGDLHGAVQRRHESEHHGLGYGGRCRDPSIVLSSPSIVFNTQAVGMASAPSRQSP